MTSLVSDIREDENYKKYKRVLKLIKKRLDIERDRSEVMSIHASRGSRAIYGEKQYSKKVLYEANAKDLMHRSRLTEIREMNSIQISYLKEARDALHRYILTKYKIEMRSYSNQQARKALLDSVTKAASEMIAESQALIDTIDMFIKDIDQAGHSIRHMVDILKLIAEKPGRVL